MARQAFSVTKLAENTKSNVTTLVKTAGWSTTLGAICVKWVIVDRRPRNFAKDTWATGKKSGRDGGTFQGEAWGGTGLEKQQQH